MKKAFYIVGLLAVCFGACKKDSGLQGNPVCDIAHSRPVTVTGKNDTNTVITTYTYDAQGRTLHVGYTDNKHSVNNSIEDFTYDTDSTAGYTGMLPNETGTNAYWVTRYMFTSAGMMPHTIQLFGAAGSETRTWDYTYDNIGQTLSATLKVYATFGTTTDTSTDISTYVWNGGNIVQWTQMPYGHSYSYEYSSLSGATFGYGNPLYLSQSFYNPAAKFKFNANFPAKETETDAAGTVVSTTVYQATFDANDRLDHYTATYTGAGNVPVRTTYTYQYECL